MGRPMDVILLNLEELTAAIQMIGARLVVPKALEEVLLERVKVEPMSAF